jgi:glycosyltransferase involved in cell wall biosynthesis
MIPTHKKIAVLHPYVSKPWWAVKMMIYISKFLQERNNSIIFHTFVYSERDFASENISFEVKTSFASKYLRFLSLLTIAFQIRKSDYVIIWNSPMHFAWLLSKILFFSKAKLIWWNHHYPWYYSRNTILLRLKRYIESCWVDKIDRVVSNSQYLKTILDHIWNIDSKLLFPVLGNIFEQNTQTSSWKDNTIFACGRWVQGKNTQMLFKTYDNLKNKCNNLILIVWWDGEELEYFRKKYKSDRNVKILWSLDSKQILKNILESSLFLFPSQIDSFWLVQIEAMSCWIPVLCFDNFEWQWVVQNNVNGFCVKSEQEFIEKSYHILSSLSLRKNLSIGALKTARWYTHQFFEKQLESVFRF